MASWQQLDYAQLPITLYPSRVRSVLLLLVCAASVAMGVWMVRSGDSGAIGWFTAIFFGAGVVVFLVNLYPGASYLTLTPEGFLLCSLFRKSLTPWSAVQVFGVISIRSNRMVAYNFTPDYPRARAMRSLSRSIADFEGALPTTYGIKAAHLAEQMNGLLAQYRATHAQPMSIETLQFDKAQ